MLWQLPSSGMLHLVLFWLTCYVGTFNHQTT